MSWGIVRDSTSTQYTSMRETLAATQGDPSAVMALLSSQPDHGAWWLDAADAELRQVLVKGRLEDAVRLGELIGVVLEARQAGGEHGSTPPVAHLTALDQLIEAVGVILDRDYRTGIELLNAVAHASNASDTLRWVAWFWTSKAASDTSDVETALAAAERALELAAGLDPQTKSTTLCTLGEVEFLAGRRERALAHLSEATRIFEQLGDRQGVAAGWLAWAQMQATMGKATQALEAATLAREANPEWTQPVLFMARQAFIAGDCDQAGWVLKLFYDKQPRPPEVDREMRLVELARDGSVPPEVIGEYARLRDLPPTDEALSQLRALVEQTPDFLQLQETLGWMLFMRGHDERATERFETLMARRLEPELHASVLLGLGCLANRRHHHRQLGARLHAAASAGRPLPAPGEESAAAAAADPPELPRGGGAASSEPVCERGGQAALTGSLELLSVPELLEFLKASRRTGTLVVTSTSGIGAIHLRRGMIAGGQSPNCTRLGEILQQTGAATEEQLMAAFMLQRSSGAAPLLGAVLVEQGVASPEQIKAALSDQVRSALLELVQWTSGRFAFDPGERGQQAPESEIDIELETQGELLDVLRVLDEQNRS